MERFFGRMPASHVRKTAQFDDGYGIKFSIQASLEGWTIIFGDGATEYKDQLKSAEDNFMEAVERAKSYFPDMRELSNSICKEE